jgi:hypothetical protein
MARRIADLLDDGDRRASMGCYGQQRVRETLAWEYSEPPLLAAYDRMFGA